MALKLNPSNKIKRRYLLIKAESRDKIEKVILDYIGILGWAKAKPFFVKSEGKIILAIDRKEVDNVRAAFEVCNENIDILKVSGTLKGLSKK